MIKRLLIALSLLIVVGCNKDTYNSILGTWALVDYTAINVRTGEKLNAITDVKTWTFCDSGSAYINGSTPITYTINDRFLTFKYINTGKEFVYEIEDLTESILKVYFYFVPGRYQDGMDQWYTFTKMK